MQVQALRSVEKYLQLEKLYVLGTNCVDNGPPEGLGKFLKAASSSPETVLHYEFMQVCHCTHFLIQSVLLTTALLVTRWPYVYVLSSNTLEKQASITVMFACCFEVLDVTPTTLQLPGYYVGW